jgi:hypothetical protein
MQIPWPCFAYLSPETFLPVTSALAGVVGFVLMFGRMTLRFVAGLFSGKRRQPQSRAIPRPYLHSRTSNLPEPTATDAGQAVSE